MIKHLLRGFGIGVIFAAVVLVLINKPKKMTDDEIIDKARELGMVTATELDSKLKEERLDVIKEMEAKAEADKAGAEEAAAEQQEEPAAEPADTQAEEPAEEPSDVTDVPSEEEPEEPSEPADEPFESVEEPAEEPEEPSEPAGEPEKPAEEPKEEPVGGETFTLVIKRGMSSEKVSDALVKAGIISDAKDFNTYLVRSGKSSFINVGVFEIPYGAEYDEIAALIAD